MCIAGVEPAQWERARGLCRRTAGIEVWVAVGLHPWRVHAESADQVTAAKIAELGACAVGELGWDKGAQASRSAQDHAADTQLATARALGLPVVLHVVGWHGHALERLARHGHFDAGGMVHGYSGSAELVARYQALGLSISVGPSILLQNARRVREAARVIDPERLLIETDATDHRGASTLADVARAVAQTRGESEDTVAERTRKNALALFGSTPTVN